MDTPNQHLRPMRYRVLFAPQHLPQDNLVRRSLLLSRQS